jgi:glycosyltransferase involved in cell wall biosynthesis
MIVAHVGPPPRRIGGPSGYLHQLQAGASTDPHPRHDVRFPAPADRARTARPRSRPPGLLTRIRRKVFGPKFYRPSVSELSRARGLVDRMLLGIATDVRTDADASLVSALGQADVIFTHEPFSAETALAGKRPEQQVWMMCHGVTPIALYAVWSWGVPEAEWQSLVAYPDVRTWTDWELDIWARVDRLILPCPEAGESFRIIDPRFNAVLERAGFVLSGASARPSGGTNPIARGAGERIGLYLGSAEPYRGFDALAKAVEALPAHVKLSIAVAGPHPGKVPAHSVFRALGRVEDVAGLLASVDFLINVNRFNLFDLSTIEATQAGKPLLLHAVGGNRAFERLGAGCVMLNDLQPVTIARGLVHLATLDEQSLRALGTRSRACWERQLTPRHMWDRHLALYDEIALTTGSAAKQP